MVCALLLLANMVASIPAYYRLMSVACSLPNQGDCISNTGQLTAAAIQSLAQLHLSLSAYAIAFVTIDVVVSLMPWAIGLLLFWRKSAEWMGLSISLLLILVGGNGAGNTLAGLWMANPRAPFFAFLLTINSAAQWIGVGAFLLTFPTGRFAPRWSAIILLFWVASFLQPNIQAPGSAGAAAVAILETILIFGGTLLVIIFRYQRVFDATQRQQTKWVVYAAVVWFIIYLAGNILSNVLPTQSSFLILAPAVTLLIPALVLYLGFGFAILRYRLWDIDTIINRTLVYGALTAILSLTYVALILLLNALTQAFADARISDTPWAIVGSTLLIVLLFNPFRRRIQTFIDRRFYRRKYDAVKILAAFATRLRTEVSLSDLSDDLTQVVEDTMQPASVSLWLRTPRQERRPHQL
jgi:hypothetical protein